jgi:uncharacterized protein YtpQ (UPF0354 family)
MNTNEPYDLTIYRLNNGNTIIGKYGGDNEKFFLVINPALVVESIDENKDTKVDIVPAIQKYYVEDGESLDGISWYLNKDVVVVVSNNTLKLNSKIVSVYNSIFTDAQSNPTV